MTEGLLNAYDRHTAFRTLSATSIRLKEIFYKHSWETRVSKPAELLALPTIFKELSAQGLAPHVEYVFFRLNNWTSSASGGAQI